MGRGRLSIPECAAALSFEAGMDQIRLFLERIGLEPTEVSLSDGRGNQYTDLFSPRTVSDLLRVMTTRPDFATFFDALPLLGVDGSETGTVPATSQVASKVVAKSGTTVASDLMNQCLLVMTRALAGYVTAQSGRQLTFAVYVNDVPIAEVNDLFAIITKQGTIAEALFERY
jgi:D-alanyl-D-alanine carboxypeptidase/D-alanyl-D-alanine-endopeptidase (penicillin-binding protein 4)